MNYYDARPLADGSGWHFTCRNDDRTWGVGYNSHVQSCSECEGRSWITQSACATCDGKGYVEAEPHAPHATAEEAYACATAYVLDTARWDGPTVDTARSVPRCELNGCEVLVTDGGGATWGFGMPSHTVLCESHRNSESLALIVGVVGQVISS